MLQPLLSSVHPHPNIVQAPIDDDGEFSTVRRRGDQTLRPCRQRSMYNDSAMH